MITILQIAILFRGTECLGAVVDPTERLALEQDGDAMPVGASFQLLQGFTDGADYGYVSREGKALPCPIFVRAQWEAKQGKYDDAISALPADVKADKFADHVSEVEKKAARAAERAANEAKV